AAPWIASPSLIQFGISTLLLATLAQSWNIIGGYAGYASFGNSVFYGLGSYGTAIAMVQWHLPFGVGLALGAVLRDLYAGSGRGNDRDRVQRRHRRAQHRPGAAPASGRRVVLRDGIRTARTDDAGSALDRTQPIRIRAYVDPGERGGRGRPGRRHHTLQGARVCAFG